MKKSTSCASCGAALLVGDRFCPTCGSGVTPTSLPTGNRLALADALPWVPVLLWASAWASGSVLQGLTGGWSSMIIPHGVLWFLGGAVAGAGTLRALPPERKLPSLPLLFGTAMGWAILLVLAPWIWRIASLLNPPYLVRDLLTGLSLVGVAAAGGGWLTAHFTRPQAGTPPIRFLQAAVSWGVGAALAVLGQLALNHF